MGQPSNQLVIDKLNEILAGAINARRRYRLAAKETQQSDLKDMFTTMASRCVEYIGEVEAAIRELGGEPDERGTALGKAHRSWISIRAKLTKGRPAVILKECIRGEQFVIDQHQGMLENHDLPTYVEATLSEHLNRRNKDLSKLKNKLSSI